MFDSLATFCVLQQLCKHITARCSLILTWLGHLEIFKFLNVFVRTVGLLENLTLLVLCQPPSQLAALHSLQLRQSCLCWGACGNICGRHIMGGANASISEPAQAGCPISLGRVFASVSLHCNVIVLKLVPFRLGMVFHWAIGYWLLFVCISFPFNLLLYCIRDAGRLA